VKILAEGHEKKYQRNVEKCVRYEYAPPDIKTLKEEGPDVPRFLWYHPPSRISELQVFVTCMLDVNT